MPTGQMRDAPGPDTDRPKNIPGLTGIRGISAMWVLLFHIQYVALRDGIALGLPGQYFWLAGWSGVDLFFMLSGFVLMHTHAHQFTRLRLPTLRRFAASRFLRLYPVNMAVLLGIYALIQMYPAFAESYRAASSGNLSTSSFVLTALLATRWFPHAGEWNEPVWSLSVEIVGYVAFPVLAVGISRIRSAAMCVLFVLAMFFGVTFYHHFFSGVGMNDLSWPGAIIRMFGLFVGGMCLRQGAGGWSRRIKRLAAPAALVGVAAIPLLCLHRYGLVLLPVAFAVVILGLYFERGLLNALVSSRPIVFLGKLSFPLYLVHAMPILAFSYYASSHAVSHAWYRADMIGLAVVLMVVAWCLHVFVERPIHRLARQVGKG